MTDPTPESGVAQAAAVAAAEARSRHDDAADAVTRAEHAVAEASRAEREALAAVRESGDAAEINAADAADAARGVTVQKQSELAAARATAAVTAAAARAAAKAAALREAPAPHSKLGTTTAANVFAGLFVLVAVVALIAVFVAPESNEGFRDGAAVIAFVTAAAVAIERIVEGVWTIVGSNRSLGGWWPFKTVRDNILDFEDKANAMLDEPLEHAIQVLQDAVDAHGTATTLVKDINLELAGFRQSANSLRGKVGNAQTTLAPGSPRFQLVSEAVDDGVAIANRAVARAAQLNKDAGSVLERLAPAADACDMVSDYITSFDDNPARKLTSLALGATLGIALAGFLGLNLFLAILGDTSSWSAGEAGILLTGLVIGLGSNPTHEVIKALERRKKPAGGETTRAPNAAPVPDVEPVDVADDRGRAGVQQSRRRLLLARVAADADDTFVAESFDPPVEYRPMQIQVPSVRRARLARRTD